MPCLHKFHDYLNLNKGYLNPDLDHLDFEPTTLIVGTFNPSWPAGNQAEWFYGRTGNNYFWDVLPRLYDPELNLRIGHPDPIQWRQFCFDNVIALTDIIASIDDAMEDEHQDIMQGYADADIANHFKEFTYTDLVGLLEEHQTIQNVYLTRQAGVDLFDARWATVEQFSIDNPARHLHLRNLLTPSASARYQIGPYREAHPDDPTPLRNFIFQSWQQEWHEI